jgi:cell division protease FtsH
MSDKVGPLTFRRKEEEVFLGRDITRDRPFSNETAQMIDSEVKVLILDGLSYVRKLLSDNKAKLDRLAERLMEKEILDSEEVDALIREGGGAVATA